MRSETAMTAADTPRARKRRVGLWLLAVCACVALMVSVGGLTRLTHSGLSMTEWRPVTGVVPPLNAQDWQRAFAGYQKIPEYQLINRGMSLDAFKNIYWWEWTHRLIGRLLGFVFLVPFMVFVITPTIERREIPKFLGLFVLGGLQGVLGWYMVKSGLAVRTDVSQYRLAAHLLFAFLIYGAIFLTALSYLAPPSSGALPRTRAGAIALMGLVFLQIGLGALVAGLDAGFHHNTWPLMDGGLLPEGFASLSPAWRNLFENGATVQFLHRMTAYTILAIAIWIFFDARKQAAKGSALARSAHIVLGAVMLQVVLGIATLLAVVPVWLGALHQLTALGVWTAALWHVDRANALRFTA